MSTTDTVSPCSDVTWIQYAYWCHQSLGGFWFISPNDEVDLHLQHIWSDVELDHISHPQLAGYSLGAPKDKEYKSVATLPEEKGS